MKERSKDVLVIAVALIAILGCGFGLGKQFSPRRPVNSGPPSVAMDGFEQVTLSNMSAALKLTGEQEEAIRSAIASTKDEIQETRKRALFEYHLQMLRLHDKIAPELNDEQRKTLEKNRKLLQDTIEKQFPILLDSTPLSLGGDPAERERRP